MDKFIPVASELDKVAIVKVVSTVRFSALINAFDLIIVMDHA
jgi:hypothetical protein